MKRSLMLFLTALAGGCAAVPATEQRPATVSAQPLTMKPGLERVLGQNARALTTLFGQPAQDVREANARKLQFGGGVCVLDAYLYAARKGQEPVVTHIDARLPDGRDIDRASCIASLSQRR